MYKKLYKQYIFGKILKIMIIIISVASCQENNLSQDHAIPRFNYMSPICLDVSYIEVVSQYEPPLKAPYVEHMLSISPERVASQWAWDRLKAVGSSGRQAVFIIRQASVLQKHLQTHNNFMTYLREQQSEYYDAKVNILLEIRDKSGRTIGSVTSIANRGRSVSNNITLDERDRILQDTISALVVDMGSALEAAIKRYMISYLVAS